MTPRVGNMNLVFDLDGVIANTYKKLHNEMEALGDCEVPPFKEWDTCLFETIVPDKEEWVRERFSDPLFCKGIEPFKEVRFWLKQNILNNHIDILTARYKFMEEPTKEWLKENDIRYHNIYHTPRVEKKYMIDVLKPDAVIEDDPRTAYEIADRGDRCYLLNRSYNMNDNVGKAIRIDGLEEIEL